MFGLHEDGFVFKISPPQYLFLFNGQAAANWKREHKIWVKAVLRIRMQTGVSDPLFGQKTNPGLERGEIFQIILNVYF